MPSYAETDTYTTVARVQSLVGRGAWLDGATPTAPSLQEVKDFMALRAVQITAKAALANVTISVSTRLNGSTAMGLADRANAFFAAGDVVFAHDSKNNRPPDRAQALWDEAKLALEMMEGVLTLTAGGGSVRTATATGGVPKADFTDFGAR